MNTYFGPLNKNSCLYFYILTVFFAIMFLFALFGIFSIIIFKNKKVDYNFFINSFVLLVNIFISYFINRLLYSMCIRSLD